MNDEKKVSKKLFPSAKKVKRGEIVSLYVWHENIQRLKKLIRLTGQSKNEIINNLIKKAHEKEK